MRLFRMLCCVLMLAVIAGGQAASAQAGNQSPDQQQQQPGQPPPNPIQGQPTGIQQELQQQQTQQKPQASTFDLGAAAAGNQDQELGELRLMTRYSQINSSSAEGLARSFHVPGENDLAEFNYMLDRPFFSTAHRFQFLGQYRGTDDISIDPERNSIQKMYLKIYGPKDDYLFGDALVNYSKLSFNNNIKGLSANWKLNPKWKLSAVGGVFIDRWGSLYKDQPDNCFAPPNAPPTFVASTDPMCGRPFTALVTGARLEYAFARDSALGFNASTSDDLVFTRQPQPFNTSPDPATNRVGSVDVKWQHKQLRVDTEYAYSFTNFERRLGVCPAPCNTSQPSPGVGVQGDWGGRAEVSYRWHKLTLRGSYVRFEPNFASINARQIADLQDELVRLSYDLMPWLTLDGTMRRSNNDLKQQLPFQNITWGPEGRFLFHDLPFYRKGVFEIGYRHRIFDGENPGPFNFAVCTGNAATDPAYCSQLQNALYPNGQCVQHTGGTGLICIDRFERDPYAEFTLPMKTTFLTLGYEHRHVVDALVPANTSNDNRVYIALRGIYDVGGWHINPTGRFELERQGQRPNSNQILQAALTNTAIPATELPALLFLEYDSNRLSTAGLYVEAPKWFILELNFRDNTSTSQAGFDRPSYKAALTYKIANDANKILIFSFERNNNFYFSNPTLNATGPFYPPPVSFTNPLNFDERIAGVTFVYKFGKRGGR